MTVVPIFPPLPPSSQHSSLPQVIPTPLFCVHGSYVLSSLATSFPILYFTSPWLFYNYLFVLLNPLASSPIPPHPLPAGNHQNALCIHESVSVLVCLVCFLDSIVDRYVFIAFLVFIVLTFFSINKSL